jgi:P27 family predicted phage terminase small subunit
MARPRKPTAIHRMHGTYRADRHGSREVGRPAGAPIRPRHLVGEALKFWQRVVPPLKGAGVVGSIDTAILTACCDLWGLYRAAVAKAAADPIDKDARIAATSYFAAWQRAAATLGLSPGDRAKLNVDLAEPREPSPFETFLGEAAHGNRTAE